MSQQRWSEEDSETFADRGGIFVPSRGEQVQTMCSLIPARPEASFAVVELGAGEGALARSILEMFPRCRYLALDGSAVMRARLGTALQSFGDRVEIGDFELADRRWRSALPTPLRCVVASLVVHHLTDQDKRMLFDDLARRLEPGGALLLADIVKASTGSEARLYATQWDEAVRAQSLEQTGSLDAFDVFRRDGWNYYRLEWPDPYDQPATLVDQLGWLRAAGFAQVGCYWMRAGHAIFGGYR